jgi:hypothetical protein
MIRRLKHFFLLISLPFVMWMFFSHVAFWHFHILENGVVIEHSHPFKNNPKPGTPFQSHHHTDFEYTVLAQISQIAGILIFLLIIGFIYRDLLEKYRITAIHLRLPLSHLSLPNLRGPPKFAF